MSCNLKVCFLVGTLGRGGAEKQLLFMLKALRNQNINCRVLCLTKGESYEKEISSLNIPIEWVGKSKNRFSRLLNIIKNLRKEPSDILQSSHFFTNIYAGIAGKTLNILSIGAIRSDLFSEMKMHGYLGKWQVSLPSFLITNSKIAYRRAIDKGISPNNIEFVQNVVDADFPIRNGDNSNKKTIRVLFVGRLDKNKCPEQFVKLASKLTNKFPDIPIKFQIAGDGILRTDLENLSEKLKLSSKKLEFLGVCNNMAEIYKQADLLISTSKREGTSNVLLEAMAFAIPVIATNVGGTPEILNENCGVLVEPENEKELYEASKKLILDGQLRERLGRNGRKYVEDNHSVKNLELQLPKIYTDLLNKK